MHNLNIDPKTMSFVDAGTSRLNDYTFESEKLNEKRMRGAAALEVGGVNESGVDGGDSEEGVRFRINQTGNIFYSTSSETLGEATKKLFDSVTVLFAAMTKALIDNNKDLFDYDAWSKVISGSGYFVEVQKFETTLEIKSNSLSLDTQIVEQLIPGLKSGSSLEIAKNVLHALNGKYSADSTDENTKFGHLLFICEELFGAPSVTVRLFFATKSSHSLVTKSPCHKSVSKSFEQKQEANTFLFVSPETIAEYASKFSEKPEEYQDLIKQLSDLISPPKDPEHKDE